MSRLLTAFRGIFLANRTTASPNCAVRSPRSLQGCPADRASSLSTSASEAQSSPQLQDSESLMKPIAAALDSDFGFRISFGSRISGFGFLLLGYFIQPPSDNLHRSMRTHLPA